MEDSAIVPSEEALEKLVFESQVTMRRIDASTSDVFDRVRRFVCLYAQLPTEPRGAALLYQDGPSAAAHCCEMCETLVVGRLSKSESHPDGADLAVEDAQMSRRHFRIDLSDEFYILQDLDSRNGTYLNNDPAKIDEVVLKAGDVIRAGASLFVFTGSAVTASEKA